MGLDISLIKIVKEPVDEACFLSTEDSPELVSKYENMISVQSFDDGTEYLGFWYQELSYQRKGVLKSFYDKYKPDEFLFHKNDLQILMELILPELRESFRKEFIDKFEEDRNFIMMSY